MQQRIGIVGGTFDPIHRAHADLPLTLSHELGWDRVLFVPAWRQPFKSGNSSPFHRHAMVVLATRDIARAGVSLIELERESVSYTVDTLEALRSEWPSSSLEWVIGDDNLEQLLLWKDVGRILELANFVVLRRGEGTVPDALASRVTGAEGRPARGAIVFANNLSDAISSTDIRQRVREGRSIEGLVHPDVVHYIGKTGLYQNAR